MTNLTRRRILGVRSILLKLYQYELILGQSSTSQVVKLTQDEYGRPYLMQPRVSQANEELLSRSLRYKSHRMILFRRYL